MFNISKINNNIQIIPKRISLKKEQDIQSNTVSVPTDLKKYDINNLKAYHPSFTAQVQDVQNIQNEKDQLKAIKSKLDKNSIEILNQLEASGVLSNKDSNDGSSVLDNLYKIATEPRIRGLNDSQILAEVIQSIANPHAITQKFGDIPNNVAQEISEETQSEFPTKALNVVSSSCVVASMEFNLASRKPAEFARFAAGLSGATYSVDKKVKMSDISSGIADGLWRLREFNTEHSIDKNWEDVTIKIKPDRNAIVRARVQTSYRDKGERSVTDVLIQSALLNLASQNTYDALTDERTGKFNSDNTGLTDMEKTFAEQIVFESPKLSVTYQQLDENGVLIGYYCEPHETKNHILKSLELGQNVIIGYTHLDENNKVNGGHEITIIGYEQDENGNGYFICNDTDDEIDAAIKINEERLLPLIHHAGISKEALSSEDIVVEPWREFLDMFQQELKNEQENEQ